MIETRAAARTSATTAEDRMADVWRQLGTVVDPELDESVTDMKFISRAEVDASNCVHVDFRLPTYWCAANFAFMMADDMRTVLRALPWVKDTKIVLGEHMYADAINTGIAEGRSFQETFGKEADGDIREVRRTFLVKAFQRRQEALINHLITIGMPPERIVAMTMAGLSADAVDEEAQKLVQRYLERRDVISSTTLASLAFVSVDDKPLQAKTLKDYLSGLRRIRANAEFNGAVCRGLLAVRFDMETPLASKTTETCRSQAAVTGNNNTASQQLRNVKG